MAGAVADLHFAPTETAGAALRAENVSSDRIHITGNTVIDALLATKARIERLSASIDRVGRVEAIHFAPAPAGASMQLVVEGATYAVPLEGLIDVGAEKARLEKALAAAQKDAASLAGRLNNPAFTEKAKPEAVEKAREDHASRTAEVERLTAALARLG